MARWWRITESALCRCRMVAALALGVLFTGPGVLAAPRTPALEYAVKAAFLLNFTRFIDWPPEAIPTDAPFTICILGDDPFGSALDQTIHGENVNGHALVVQRTGRAVPKTCQILYVSVSEKGALPEGLEPGVLTVGEGEAFIRDGGMIAFVLDNRRVRFNINLPATRTGKLTLSSRLLAVAKAVEK